MDSPQKREQIRKPPEFGEALWVWLRIGCIGFGGPSGQIAILHREIVDKREWIRGQEFDRALKFCMLLPGPEAQQLATYLGWRLHGIRGGIAAGVLFLLPAALLLWGLSLLYVTGQDAPLIRSFFEGLKPAVVAIVASALWRIGRRTITSWPLALIALTAFLLFIFHASYPAVVLGFGLAGSLLLPRPEEKILSNQPPSLGDSGTWGATLCTGLTIGALWFLPVMALLCWLGLKALPVQVALFFGKVALFSFGGAYAALSYVALHAASDWGWVTSAQMMDGLGMAETTPGPLLMALQFVAFVACFKAPGILPPLLAATIGSLVALWSLFLPSFLWIFALAPHMERMAQNRRIDGALSAIGAVVTAVIASLAVWFAGSVFVPHGSIAIGPLVIAIAAFLLLQFQKVGIITLILGCGLIGVVFGMMS